MTSDTKVKLQNITISVMTVTIALIVLWFIAYAVSETFDLKVFQEKTSEFLLIFIAAAFAIVFCSAFLSVSLNISLIADSRSQQSGAVKKNKFPRKYFMYFISVAAILILFLFSGDALSRKRHKDNLVRTSEYIVIRYSGSIYSIAGSVNDTSKYDEIFEQLRIISSLREEFPEVKVLSHQFYNGQLVFTEFEGGDSYYGDSRSIIKLPIYKSNSEDTEYLRSVFLNNNQEKLIYYRNDDYYLYYPVIRNNSKIVIRFSKSSRYGKFGSF